MKNNLNSPFFDEEERLKEFYLYDTLDTASEKEFDELVHLASKTCDCPVAVITFIDDKRQWFKAKKGIGLPPAPIDISFCTHTVLSDQPVIVNDATTDERFANNPDVVGGLHIRFYAGFPIYSSRKKRIGALCVIDHERRELNDVQIETLKIISRQITFLLEQRLMKKLLQQDSNESVRNSEKAFAFFFNQSVVPKWIYEMGTLKFLQVNDAVTSKYGYTREEFLQMRVFDIRTDEEKKNLHQLLQNVKQNDRCSTFTSVHQTKDGRLIDVEVTISDCIYMGKAARMATLIDITEREHLRRALKQEQSRTEEKIKRAAIVAKEEVQDNIGKELHDNINQLLVSAKLFLEVAEKQEDMRMEIIKRCKETLNEAIKEIRLLSKSLVAIDEDEFNLTGSILDLINAYSVSNNFKMHFSYDENLEGLPFDLKLCLFRIVQEQVNNISKYAAAPDVWITIEIFERLLMQIKDNGKGFDTQQKSPGIGLNNIKQRTEFYNGSFQIQSSPGHGTTLFIEIPLNEIRMAV